MQRAQLRNGDCEMHGECEKESSKYEQRKLRYAAIPTAKGREFMWKLNFGNAPHRSVSSCSAAYAHNV